MALLNYFCLLLLAASVAKSDIPLVRSDHNDIVREKLESKLNDISEKNQVALRSQNFEVAKKDDYQVSDFKDAPQCPNFDDVLKQAKNSIADLAQMIKDFNAILATLFDSEKHQCHMSLNPLSTLKCFLRVLASGYKDITSLVQHAFSAESDLSQLITQYRKYSTKCTGTFSLSNTLQLMEIIKYINSQLED